MHIRRFFLWSLVLAILAVGLDLVARSQYQQGARAKARILVAPENERAAASAEAKICGQRSTVIGVVGLALALASLVLVIVSARRREPAWRAITFALLVVHMVLQFAMT